MRVLVAAYGSLGCVELVVARAVRSRACRAEVRLCALVHAATTPSAGGVMAAGVWR